ncbi:MULTISPECIES: SHOCT domain-containing protein [unclassified Sphingomonas]|uniref:OB-fold protein n=1 Tax=unclassified Sphingomonas TaxID=196159 RepID=UPI00226A8F0A|nr:MULTISPECIES: SHOCT domain-containing protein [unclassified Sphingomonas]
MSTAEELAKLAQLRDQGVLTEDEFQQQKAAVLRGDHPATPAAVAPAPGKRSMGKGCLVLLGILIVLGVIGAIIGGGSHGGTAAKETAAAEAPIAVTATELFNAYQANEAAAQERYGKHPLLVSGKIASIDLDIVDNPVVQLRTPNEFMSASARLGDNSKAKASSLSKGQSIQLLCASVSEVISVPQLSDCEIQ